jgi:pimeloyl-ACP methyl ester carboxylesterase
MRRREVIAGIGAIAAVGACSSKHDPDDYAATHPPIGDFTLVRGRRIHFWRKGDGHPVVLIHGASGNLRDWTYRPALLLARDHDVIAFDRPGFGYSERSAENEQGPAEQARTLVAATRELGIDRPIVVGHSYGAAVALAWGLADPDAVAGLVLVSGASMPTVSRPGVAETLGLDRLLALAYRTYAKATADNGGVERFVERAFRPQMPPPGYADYVGAPLALRDATLKANTADILGLNAALRRMAPEYETLTTPVEIIHGELDWLLPAAKHAIPLERLIPRASIAIAKGVGHMAHHAAAETLQAKIAKIAQLGEMKSHLG